MKRLFILVLLMAILGSLVGCYSDPMDNLYTKNIYPGSGSYQIGTATNNYIAGYFQKLYVNGATLYIGGVPFTGGVSGNITLPISQSDVVGLTDNLSSKESIANKGMAGGYAPLDNNGRVPPEKLGVLPKGGADWYLRYDQVWAAPTANATWGGIVGTLSSQTDLQGVLDAKETPSGAQAKVDSHNSTYVHTDITLNTAARHSHSNKTILDNITESFTTPLKATYDSLVSSNHTHTNMATLNNIQEALTTVLKSNYDTAYTNSHTHSNKSTLDAIQEAFTSALKTSYDWLVTNITSAWKTLVDNHLANTSNPHSVTKAQVGLTNVTDDAQIAKSLIDAKGDVIVGTADNTPARLAYTAVNNDVLMVDTTTASGWKVATPSSGASDVVYVATPANFNVASTTDVTIVTRDVTGVVAGDQLIVEATFLIMNNSTATRVYVITVDFDAAFDVEHSTGACAFSSTLWQPVQTRAVLNVRASNLSYAFFETEIQLAAGIASGGDTTMAATHLRANGWGTTTSDLSGTTTVVLKVRSANTTATQTLYLLSMTIRKVRPS